jgi:hypothetical protein
MQRRDGTLLDLKAMQFEGCDDYHPFDISGLQLYNPIYRELFGKDTTVDVTEATTLDHQYEVVDANYVRDTKSNTMEKRSIHFKFSPLLDPFAYMIGKYSGAVLPATLPSWSGGAESSSSSVIRKLANPCNAAYVDGFFNYLSNLLLEKHGFLHGISFYGSYLGIQRKFKVDVSDDVEHLRNSRFFNESIGKLFSVPGWSQQDFLNVIGGSRRNKKKIDVIEDALLDDIESLDETGLQNVEPNLEPPNNDDGVEEIYAKEEYNDNNVSERSHGSSDSELNYSSSSENENEEEDDDDEVDEKEEEAAVDEESVNSSITESIMTESTTSTDRPEEAFGLIYDFPCQIICMEKCDGTLDELFENGSMDTHLGAAALMQVIMTLLAYQKAFGFTHNDLHTNNIMYVNTDLDYLVYRFNGRVYKVPTYGRIFKIIDFGRSIYTFQEHVFCSDSFFAKGDAATQYNFGPCYNPNKPVLEPNPSFDLCRLGVSIFDFVVDVDLDVGNLDAFQKTIRRWCQDDCKHNVLYKRNGDDRYPNFKLYKMIARTVHRHTPQAQLDFAMFKQYLVKEEKVPVQMDLDALPSYQ